MRLEGDPSGRTARANALLPNPSESV